MWLDFYLLTPYLWATANELISLLRSSCSQMFFKIGVLKNLADLTGKPLCWSLPPIKLQACRPTNPLKRDNNTGTLLLNLQNP